MPIETRPIDLGNPFATARNAFERLTCQLGAAETLSMTHSEVEALVHAEGLAVLRQLYQDHLDLRAAREERQSCIVGADGDTRTHRRDSSRPLMGIFGGVTVPRIAYGGRAMTSLHPMDAELNLPPDLFSFGVRRRVAEEAARGSYDTAIEALARTTGAMVGKRQAEELAIKAAGDFDAFYAGTVGTRSQESILVISGDGKGVVMRHEDLREKTRKAAKNSNRKLAKRLAKGEKRNRKRMATVAAVYSIAKFLRTPEDIVDDLRRKKKAEKRPKPQNKRVWASVAKEPEEVFREAFVEALSRDPDRKKTWVAVVDGNATQIEILGKLAAEFGVTLVIVLDIIHVIEYLWGAAHVLFKDGTPDAEGWVTERLHRILLGESSLVAAGMRRSATFKNMPAKKRKAIDACARYLLNHTDLLRYQKFLAAGFPIASGVIEGACRHLIGDRMDITGARWSLQGAEAILRLRSLRASGDFEEYWRFHEAQEAGRNHAALFALPVKPPETGTSAILAS